MLPRSPSCWFLSWPLITSFSSRSSLRPALVCCSATESPASCTTTVTGAWLTPSGVHTGVTRLSLSAAGSGRTAPELELPSTPKTSASAADANRISSPHSVELLARSWPLIRRRSRQRRDFIELASPVRSAAPLAACDRTFARDGAEIEPVVAGCLGRLAHALFGDGFARERSAVFSFH